MTKLWRLGGWQHYANEAISLWCVLRANERSPLLPFVSLKRSSRHLIASHFPVQSYGAWLWLLIAVCRFLCTVGPFSCLWPRHQHCISISQVEFWWFYLISRHMASTLADYRRLFCADPPEIIPGQHSKCQGISRQSFHLTIRFTEFLCFPVVLTIVSLNNSTLGLGRESRRRVLVSEFSGDTRPTRAAMLFSFLLGVSHGYSSPSSAGACFVTEKGWRLLTGSASLSNCNSSRAIQKFIPYIFHFLNN